MEIDLTDYSVKELRLALELLGAEYIPYDASKMQLLEIIFHSGINVSMRKMDWALKQVSFGRPKREKKEKGGEKAKQQGGQGGNGQEKQRGRGRAESQDSRGRSKESQKSQSKERGGRSKQEGRSQERRGRSKEHGSWARSQGHESPGGIESWDELSTGDLRRLLNGLGMEARMNRGKMLQMLRQMGITPQDVGMDPSQRSSRKSSRNRRKKTTYGTWAAQQASGEEDFYDYMRFMEGEEPWYEMPECDTWQELHEEFGFQNPYEGADNDSYSYYEHQVHQRVHQSTQPLTPEQAMERALREPWKPDKLSIQQCRQLLGLSGRPSEAELRRAKREGIKKWHPDRNPNNPQASSAFQLIMAASERLAA